MERDSLGLEYRDTGSAAKRNSMTVDIITPAYNSADTVEETLESVLAQDMGDWRYWLIDDGSSDATAELVKGYLGDPRIRLVQQDNAGVAAALNRGLELHGIGLHLILGP